MAVMAERRTLIAASSILCFQEVVSASGKFPMQKQLQTAGLFTCRTFLSLKTGTTSCRLRILNTPNLPLHCVMQDTKRVHVVPFHSFPGVAARGCIAVCAT